MIQSLWAGVSLLILAQNPLPPASGSQNPIVSFSDQHLADFQQCIEQVALLEPYKGLVLSLTHVKIPYTLSLPASGLWLSLDQKGILQEAICFP